MIWVSNIGGRDEFIDYSVKQSLDSNFHGHPPINFHSFCAATGGTFSDRAFSSKDREHDVGLVLLNRQLDASLAELKNLKSQGLETWLTWKECGRHQVQQRLTNNKDVVRYQEVLMHADRVIHVSSDPLLFASDSIELMTPYPVDLEQWDFSIAEDKRTGIFLGTREFKVPTRNHLYALSIALDLAREVSSFVTVINRDKSYGRRLLKTVFKAAIDEGVLRVIDGRLSYVDYMETMAKHRIVFQWDRSGVPGQVAGDALLCRTICIGGDSLIEKLVYGYPVSGESIAIAAKCLGDDGFYLDEIERVQDIALEKCSFKAFRSRFRGLRLER